MEDKVVWVIKLSIESVLVLRSDFCFFSLFAALYPKFHYESWSWKLIAYAGLIIFPFFVPNSVFNVYSEIARVVSLIFLLLQIFILIDMAYDLHQYLREDKIEHENGEVHSGWQCAYLVLCIFLLSGGIVGIGLMFHYYGGCGLHQFFIAVALIFGIIIVLVSITEKAGVGLLVPAVVFDYCVYLCWQGVYSNPDRECNPYVNNYENPGMVALGLLITAFSLTYTTWSAGISAPNLFRMHKEQHEDGIDLEVAPKAEAKAEAKVEGAAAGAELPAPVPGAVPEKQFRSHWFFHMVMAMGAIFMAMLLTNWGQSDGGDQQSNTDVSIESMWVKIVSSWCTFLLFLWTLAAPIFFPDREFTDGQNSFRKGSK